MNRREWTIARLAGIGDYEDAKEEEAAPAAFVSQLAYGPRGHLICTAVTYALAYGFLAQPHQPISRCMSRRRIHSCMRACHAFFEEHDIDGPLMLREMQQRFPLAQYGVIEGDVAGLTSAASDADGITDDGRLLLEPLTKLIRRMRRRSDPRRTALLVTCSEHTRLVYSEAPGKMQAFDPLRGFVDDMSARRGEPYAGLLLASST